MTSTAKDKPKQQKKINSLPLSAKAKALLLSEARKLGRRN